MATTSTQFERWISSPREDEHLEFKEAKSQFGFVDLLRYTVALANEGGGRLILGVTNRPPRQVVGSAAFMNRGDVQKQVLDKLGVRIDLEEFIKSERRVVVCHIPGRPAGTAYHHEGAYLMRSGESLVPMPESQLRRIFDEGKPDWLAEPAARGVGDDGVVELLDTPSYFDLLHLPYPSTRPAVLKRFTGERLILGEPGDWTITNLGAILFAKRLGDFDSTRRKLPRFIVYDGPGKLNVRLDEFWTPGYAAGYDRLVQFVQAQVPKNEVIESALRREVTMFPEVAIRELMGNALIHQDFQETGTSVMIELYSDRLEIANPGLPVIPPDRFIDEYRSRNERLADLMRRLRFCEERSSGIDRVVGAAEAFQLPAPDFRAGEVHTTAVLYAHRGFEEMDRDDRIRACYQHCCLRHVMNRKMTNQSLRARFNLPDEKAYVASDIIRQAGDEGRVKPEDPSKTSKRYASYVPYWA